MEILCYEFLNVHRIRCFLRGLFNRLVNLMTTLAVKLCREEEHLAPQELQNMTEKIWRLPLMSRELSRPWV